MMKVCLISEADYAQEMARLVVPYLQARKRDVFYEGADGKPLHARIYRAEAAHGAVVVSHGFTESCEKFDEMAYYFLQNGYSVLIPEHRGHGQSYRQLSDRTLTHIDHFSQYVDDFAAFIDAVARKEGQPLYLYAHSMGGAVGVLYMQRCPTAFQKAVLTSPMIAPATGGIPVGVGRLITGFFRCMGQGERRSFTAGEYPGFEAFENSCDTSRARFDYYEQKKRATPHLQNYAPTYAWVHEALGVTHAIFRGQGLEKIQTPVLLFSAQLDTVVKNAPQAALVKRLRQGRLREVAGAKHEIYASTDDVLAGYLEELLTFYAQ